MPGSTPPNWQLIQKYTCSRTEKGYALAPTYINSGSIDLLPTMDAVTNITSNSLVIHSVGTLPSPAAGVRIVFDAYYSR
ncbi:MAG TPA: hypothetical protein VHB54_03520 [Mucilaginibacter sp.]|nr:hypothetical protein [Mucilaginibacter sp.]